MILISDQHKLTLRSDVHQTRSERWRRPPLRTAGQLADALTCSACRRVDLVGCSPLLARWSTYRIRGYGWEAAERCAAFALRLEWLVVSGSLSQEDIDHLREGYRLFEDGDPAFLDRFTPDAALVFPETLPKGGTYASPWEALEYFNTIGELFEAPHPEPEEFIRDGDRVVALGHFHGRSRATSEQVVIRFAHVYRLTGVEGPVSQQRYTAFELFIDTAAVVAAITRTPGHRQASRVTDPGPGVR